MDRDSLIERLQAGIRQGDFTPASLRAELERYREPALPGMPLAHDSLDALVDGILDVPALPTVDFPWEAEMVGYRAAPARVILDLVDRLALGSGDVFYDLGAGLGRTAILAHLLSGALARGVEIVPAYCRQAARSAQALGLADVRFICADARHVDYLDGTVFFLFTPFMGTMMQAVLEKLRQAAQTHPIRICTCGACALEVGLQPWLAGAESAINGAELAIFHSLEICR
jgi:SAM-dependent methyltransferase